MKFIYNISLFKEKKNLSLQLIIIAHLTTI